MAACNYIHKVTNHMEQQFNYITKYGNVDQSGQAGRQAGWQVGRLGV